MKYRLLPLVIIIFFININCKKEKPSDVLPAITQTGANTFGCKINGVVWVPYFQCAPFTGQCSEMQTNFIHVNSNSFLPYSFQLAVERSDKVDNEGSFVIANFSIGQSPSTIWQTGNVFDSLNISCTYNNQLYVYYGFPGFSQHAGNNFIITKLDTVNKIMSGIFNFKLFINYSDSIIVTDGRFDFKIQDYCRCSP